VSKRDQIQERSSTKRDQAQTETKYKERSSTNRDQAQREIKHKERSSTKRDQAQREIKHKQRSRTKRDQAQREIKHKERSSTRQCQSRALVIARRGIGMTTVLPFYLASSSLLSAKELLHNISTVHPRPSPLIFVSSSRWWSFTAHNTNLAPNP